MQMMRTLLNIACGQPLLCGAENKAQRVQAMLAAGGGALVLAALWGLAAGSSAIDLALANIVKVPLVVLLAAIGAMPAGLLTYKLIGAPYRASDLLLSYAAGVFSGTMVMAVLAPLVALYYHSSAWAGPMLALGSAVLGIAVGTVIFVRGLRRRVPQRGWVLNLPLVVFFALHTAALVQLIAVASPILPETTVFDQGVDRLWQ